MGRVVSFSEFAQYRKELNARPEFSSGTIFDTNILIALHYENSRLNDEVGDFFQNHLLPAKTSGFKFYTTVNTRSEFLDFARRLLMTEHLVDLADVPRGLRIPQAAKTQIQYQHGLVLKRQRDHGSDPVYADSQIKKIKSVFSAGRHSGQSGWLELCDAIMQGKLDRFEDDLNAFGIQYISQHEPSQTNLFSKKIDWPEAKRISEKTCLGLSDSMIINAFQCSRFPFMVSADFDIGYSVLASNELRDVVMPDSVASKYRTFHFDE